MDWNQFRCWVDRKLSCSASGSVHPCLFSPRGHSCCFQVCEAGAGGLPGASCTVSSGCQLSSTGFRCQVPHAGHTATSPGSSTPPRGSGTPSAQVAVYNFPKSGPGILSHLTSLLRSSVSLFNKSIVINIIVFFSFVAAFCGKVDLNYLINHC